MSRNSPRSEVRRHDAELGVHRRRPAPPPRTGAPAAAAPAAGWRGSPARPARPPGRRDRPDARTAAGPRPVERHLLEAEDLGPRPEDLVGDDLRPGGEVGRLDVHPELGRRGDDLLRRGGRPPRRRCRRPGRGCGSSRSASARSARRGTPPPPTRPQRAALRGSAPASSTPVADGSDPQAARARETKDRERRLDSIPWFTPCGAGCRSRGQNCRRTRAVSHSGQARLSRRRQAPLSGVAANGAGGGALDCPPCACASSRWARTAPGSTPRPSRSTRSASPGT